MRNILKRRAPVQSAIGPKKHLTFPEAVAYWMKKDGSMGLRLYKRQKTGLGFEFVSEMPLRDAAGMAAHAEQSLSDAHGGGVYQFRITNSSSNEVGQYDLRIAGVSKDRDGERSERKSSKMEELYMTFMTTIMTKALEGGFGGGAQQLTITDLISIIDKLKGDDTSKELLVTMANNFITSKENTFANLRELAEAAKMFAPEVRQEDPMTALVTGLAPLAGQLLFSRQMQAGQAAPQQPAGGMQALPGPGEPAPGASEPAAGSQHPADAYITMLREDITAGVEPQILADKIIGLTQNDGLFPMGGEPHPTLRPLATERDPTKLPQAFDEFCRGIPELASNPELARKVGLALLARLMQFAAEAEPAEGPAEPSEQDPAASAHEPIAETYAAGEPVAEDAAPAEQEGAAADDTDNTASTDAEGRDAAETAAPGRDDGENAESGPTGEVAGR